MLLIKIKVVFHTFVLWWITFFSTDKIKILRCYSSGTWKVKSVSNQHQISSNHNFELIANCSSPLWILISYIYAFIGTITKPQCIWNKPYYVLWLHGETLSSNLTCCFESVCHYLMHSLCAKNCKKNKRLNDLNYLNWGCILSIVIIIFSYHLSSEQTNITFNTADFKLAELFCGSLSVLSVFTVLSAVMRFR